jgi:hypothetical protein
MLSKKILLILLILSKSMFHISPASGRERPV